MFTIFISRKKAIFSQNEFLILRRWFICIAPFCYQIFICSVIVTVCHSTVTLRFSFYMHEWKKMQKQRKKQKKFVSHDMCERELKVTFLWMITPKNMDESNKLNQKWIFFPSNLLKKKPNHSIKMYQSESVKLRAGVGRCLLSAAKWVYWPWIMQIEFTTNVQNQLAHGN